MLSPRPVFTAAAAAAGVAAVFVFAHPAAAEPGRSATSSSIVYSGPLALELHAPSFDYAEFDFDGDGSPDAYLDSYRWEDGFGDFNNTFEIYSADGRFDYVYRTTPWPEEWLVRRLFAGEVIDDARDFAANTTGAIYDTNLADTLWREGQRGFIGFRFRPFGEPTVYHYGWIDVEVSTDGEILTVHGWAYQGTAGEAIAAGDTGGGVGPPEITISDLRLHFELIRGVTDSGTTWILFPFLDTTDPAWSLPVTVLSPTESFQGFLNHPEGITASSFVSNSFALVTQRMTGTWTLRFELPGGQAVSYSFAVDANSMSSAETFVLDIVKPTEGNTYASAGFSLQWNLPETGTWQFIQAVVASVDRSGSFPVFNTVLNQFFLTDVTSIVPDPPLPFGEMRLRLTVRNDAATFPGLTVGSPVDAASEPAPFAWSVGAHSATSRRDVFFFLNEGGPGLTPFQAWQAANFTPAQLADPAVSGPFASPAGDGLTNLEKFAFGLGAFAFDAAKLPRPGLTVPANPGDPVFGTLSFTIATDDPDLTFRPELSHDLVLWRYNGDGQGGPVFGIESTPNGAGGIDVVATTTEPFSLGALLMRLRLFYAGP